MNRPPDAGPDGSELPAVFSCPDKDISVLRNRPDFLKAARARRQAMTSMVVQARRRTEEEHTLTPVRVGFTCSKKVGNAVARNRAKRRLRAAAHIVLREMALPGHDYVLIGRRDATAQRPFPDLLDDLRKALSRLHR